MAAIGRVFISTPLNIINKKKDYYYLSLSKPKTHEQSTIVTDSRSKLRKNKIKLSISSFVSALYVVIRRFYI